MSKKIAAAIVAISLITLPVAGCYQMGETTGKAVKSVEKAPDDFQKGYEKGTN